MFLRRSLMVMAASLIAATLLLSADVTGKWKGQLEGQDRETILTLKLDGSQVTGTMSDPEGKERPLKGSLDGDKISLTVDSEWQGSPVKLLINGTVAEDEMKLTISTEGGEWSAAFTAKRG